MLNEDGVVRVTCSWLESQGWHVDSRCFGTSKGDDIAASNKSGEHLLVECKGSVSPKTGNPFSGNYAWRATSGAVFNCLRAIETRGNFQLVAMAIPNISLYRNLLGDMQQFCLRNKLYVFWVSQDGVADVWQPNNSFQPTVIPLSRSAGG
jgi:hypothetical protein